MKSRIAAVAILLAATAACNRGESANNAAAPAPQANGEAAAATPAAADNPAFAEYDRLCTDLSDVNALNAAAAAAGWERFSPEAQSPLGQLLALADSVTRGAPEAGTLVNTAYRKTVNGRELHAVVSSLTGGPLSATECRVYDFAAAAPPSAETIAAWTSAPTTSSNNQMGVTSWEWSPGFRSGLDQQTVVHIAADSPMRRQIPAIGLGITATKSGAGSAQSQPAEPETK